MFKNFFRERRRSAAVQGLTMVNGAVEATFDGFVHAAAVAFDAPIAALSLIHRDRQTITAGYGLEPACLPRDKGFCTHALAQNGILECCDPARDRRFAGLPSVTGNPAIRYYIGAPLVLLSGIGVGVLCVADHSERRPASDDQKAYLTGLARQASLALEARLDLWGNVA